MSSLNSSHTQKVNSYQLLMQIDHKWKHCTWECQYKYVLFCLHFSSWVSCLNFVLMQIWLSQRDLLRNICEKNWHILAVIWNFCLETNSVFFYHSKTDAYCSWMPANTSFIQQWLANVLAICVACLAYGYFIDSVDLEHEYNYILLKWNNVFYT